MFTIKSSHEVTRVIALAANQNDDLLKNSQTRMLLYITLDLIDSKNKSEFNKCICFLDHFIGIQKGKDVELLFQEKVEIFQEKVELLKDKEKHKKELAQHKKELIDKEKEIQEKDDQHKKELQKKDAQLDAELQKKDAQLDAELQ